MSLCAFGPKNVRVVIRNIHGCDLMHIRIEIKMNPYNDKEIYLINLITIFKQIPTFIGLGGISLPLTSNGCIKNT